MVKPISASPNRNTVQKSRYIKRQLEENNPVNEDLLKLFEKMANDHAHKFDNIESRKNDMEYDLLTTDWILEKVRLDNRYAQNLYAALCNNKFTKNDFWPILKSETWSCSWRYAGGIVADMQQQGDHMDWYCSGIGNKKHNPDVDPGVVSESEVTDEIKQDLLKLGWIVMDHNWEDE